MEESPALKSYALKELKLARNLYTEKRKALTVQEQKILLDFLKNSSQYRHWYPIFAAMLGTGLRVGEITGLRWQDIDLDEGIINVNHTLVYYCHNKGGCSFGVNTPKTRAGERIVPMIESVKEAFIMEKDNQEQCGISSILWKSRVLSESGCLHRS
jgi:integrase